MLRGKTTDLDNWYVHDPYFCTKYDTKEFMSIQNFTALDQENY